MRRTYLLRNAQLDAAVSKCCRIDVAPVEVTCQFSREPPTPVFALNPGPSPPRDYGSFIPDPKGVDRWGPAASRAPQLLAQSG